MAFRVSLSAPAESDAYAAFEHIRDVAPMRAEEWLVQLFQVISTLEKMPARCAIIPEAKEVGFTARHLLYGKGRVSIASFFTSARRTNTSVFCAYGTLPVMRLPPPTLLTN